MNASEARSSVIPLADKITSDRVGQVERVARSITLRSERRQENTLYQGVVFLARGSTVSLPAVERFRMLRAKIERMNLADNKFKLIAVTSAVPQEGKSLISVNLARALSIDPQGKTLLIDCDLRRPTVHQYFDMPRDPGLSDVLTGHFMLKAVIRPMAPGLDVITAGSPLADPTRAVDQPEFLECIEELKKEYRYIIMDCPPVLMCPEPITLSSIAQSTLLVVRAWRTDKRLVSDAARTIGRSRIMGIVMNDGIDASKEYLDYGYYGTVPRPPAQRKIESSVKK